MNLLGPEHNPPLEELQSNGNTWRNIIAGGTIAVLLGGMVVLSHGNGSFQAGFSSETLLPFDATSLLRGKAGGDVVVSAPIPEPPKLPVLIGTLPDPTSFTAAAMIVKDHETGMVLYKKNEYEPRPIASLTKLMSALVVLEKTPNWSATTTVTTDEVVDTSMQAGDTYDLDNLWKAALVGSSNKAILSLSDTVGWPRPAFVERMNQKALELGMSSAYFTEPTGLDAGNMASASDLAILLSEAMKKEKIQQTVTIDEILLKPIGKSKTHQLYNTNWLLLGWIPNTLTDFRGGKTGYIPESGFNFVMQVGDGAGHVLDVVVLGAAVHEARFTEARDITEVVFDAYRWPDESSTSTVQ